MSARDWLGWSVGTLCTALVAGVANAPTELRGATFSHESPPRRIVSLNLAADEVLLALVSPDRIAALTYLADDPRYSNVTQEAKSVGPRVTANAEQVIGLDPDLIVVGHHTSESVRGLLRETGARLVELRSFESLDAIEWNILTIGRAVAEARRARVMVAELETRLTELGERRPLPRPRALYYAPGGFTAGADTVTHDVLVRLGAENLGATAGIEGFRKLSAELIVTLNPEVVFLGDGGGRSGLRAQLLKDPAFRDVEAIRRENVHELPTRLTSTVSQHVIAFAESLAFVLDRERAR